MKRAFIDEPIFGFGEVLRLGGFTRGAIEGYLKREIVIPSAAKITGSGHHRKYTGRDILKFVAVAFLSKAGLKPEDIKWVVADKTPKRTDPKTGKVLEWGRGRFNELVDDFIQLGPTDEFRKKSPLVFNQVVIGLGDLLPFLVPGTVVSFDKPEKLLAVQRKADAVTYLVFDAPVLIWYGFQVLENYLAEREAQS